MSVSYNLKRLIAPQTLTTTSTLYYTVPSSTTTALKQLVISNTSGQTVGVSVYLVPSGGTATNSNLMFPNIAVSSNSTLTFDLNQVLNTNDQIYASASSGASINIMASGFEAA